MPRATVNTTETFRKDLKSLPAKDGEEGGWIELRKLSYGEILARRDMATKIAVEGLDSGNDMKADIDIIQKAVSEYEMSHSIVDHNLTDDQDRKLNFNNPVHVTNLSPQVGQEISDLIDKLNDWEGDSTGKDEPSSMPGSDQQ